MQRNLRWILGAVLLAGVSLYAGGGSFLGTLNNIRTLASTVPDNGDVNPYGVAVVPVTTGRLYANQVLVSNFNNSNNLQGTGITIMQVSIDGHAKQFARINPATLPGPCPGGVGLTTALVALRSGFVIVGSLPTTNGMSGTAKAGCLIVVDSNGTPVSTISGHGIDGPWDMTALDMGTGAILFVTNVLNGTVAAGGNVVDTGSVLRITLSIPLGGTPSAVSFATIASKFPARTDPAALVIGPTGLALDAAGTLYVADTLQNRIAKILNAIHTTADAHAGTTVSINGALNQPLGLALAPNGNILTVNAGDGFIVETMPNGVQLTSKFIDVSNSGNGAGTLFGLALNPAGNGVYFVDDGNNTLNLLH
jgi:hypothetical protein